MTPPVIELAPPCLVCDGSDSRLRDGAGADLRCCDDSCLEKIAYRQCILECGKGVECGEGDKCPGTPAPSPTASGAPSRKRKRDACSDHASKTREDFASMLLSVGCICRELILRNLQPCCKEARLAGSNRRTRPGSASSLANLLHAPSADVDDKSCVGETGTACDQEATSAQKEQCCAETSCAEKPGEMSCAAKAKGVSCCASSSCTPDAPRKAAYENDCCDEQVRPSVLQTRVGAETKTDTDIEKGGLIAQHVSLSVEGLTCTGCETKLFRALHGIPGVHNLSASLVMSKAEFDLDGNASPIDEIIKAVEKSTGFSCKRVNTEGQELDVLIDGDAKAFAERDYPKGILQLSAIDKRVLRITFDPDVVGARAVLADLFGTRLRLAVCRISPDLENGQKHVRETAWFTLASAALTIPVLVLAWASVPPRAIVYGSVSLALATAVQVLIAGRFYASALRALIFTRVIEMDLLIVLSTTTAYVFSIVAFTYLVTGHPLETGEFFETSTLLVTLVMLGRLVSAFARQKAVESVSIRSLQVQTTTLCDADGRNDEKIDARLLQYGDNFKVGPDSRIGTDGIIVTGTTEVDESMVTGEALPIDKSPGSPVIAGSINTSGVIVVRLTNLPGNNTISTIAAMVDEAKFQKAKTQEMVDIVAGWFVPAILVLTLLTVVIWIAVGIRVRLQGTSEAVVAAITYGITVLIVSCPCAIGLCVPMVTVVAGGAAAKNGVIFKTAVALESARKVTHAVFDKTGTLTAGELSIAEEIFLGANLVARPVIFGLTSNSKHPVSMAISSHLVSKGIKAAEVENVRALPGQGVEGTYGGRLIRCGNTRWLSLQNLPEARRLLDAGLTVFGVTVEGVPAALFGLHDHIRPEARRVLAELKKRKIAISIVSGDDAGATDAVAAELAVPITNVRSRCTPGDKQEYMAALATDKRVHTLFCGDGTNDAIALACADVGVHMSSGSDVSQAAADVVLLRPALTGVLVALDLSRAAMHRVSLNFAWSFVYNLFAILLAAGAFVNARIPPQYAGLGEIVSVLPVILVALQLKWFRRDY